MSQAPYSLAMDVTGFDSAEISVWRGNLHASGTFGVTFEDSTDREKWFVCQGTSADYDPGVRTEVRLGFTLAKQYFRACVVVGGAGLATHYIYGRLIPRQS